MEALVNFKTPVWRSKKYLKWVKSLPCCACGAPADDPHHITARGFFGGMGTKPSDVLTMPMCRGCHNKIHQTPSPMLDKQWEWITKTVAKAAQDGILEVKING